MASNANEHFILLFLKNGLVVFLLITSSSFVYFPDGFQSVSSVSLSCVSFFILLDLGKFTLKQPRSNLFSRMLHLPNAVISPHPESLLSSNSKRRTICLIMQQH